MFRVYLDVAGFLLVAPCWYKRPLRETRFLISLSISAKVLRAYVAAGDDRVRRAQPVSFLSSRSKSLPVDGLQWRLCFA